MEGGSFALGQIQLFVSGILCQVSLFFLPLLMYLGRLIDWFQTSSPCASLAFSPQGDFLATAHTDNVAIFLWLLCLLLTLTLHRANQDYFGKVYLRPVSDVAPHVEMPHAIGIQEDEYTGDRQRADDMETENTHQTKDQLSKQLITMSRLPRTSWQSLVHIETIKVLH